MKLSTFFGSSRIALFVWLGIALGSCSTTYYVNNSSNIFIAELIDAATEGHCQEFTRTLHIGHQRPVFPKVDVSKLSNDERTELLLSFTERLKAYLDNEERYLAADILRHRETCKNTVPVFQK